MSCVTVTGYEIIHVNIDKPIDPKYAGKVFLPIKPGLYIIFNTYEEALYYVNRYSYTTK